MCPAELKKYTKLTFQKKVELALPTNQKSLKKRDQDKVYKMNEDPEVGRNKTNKYVFSKKRLKIVTEELVRGGVENGF